MPVLCTLAILPLLDFWVHANVLLKSPPLYCIFYLLFMCKLLILTKALWVGSVIITCNCQVRKQRGGTGRQDVDGRGRTQSWAVGPWPLLVRTLLSCLHPSFLDTWLLPTLRVPAFGDTPLVSLLNS